MNKKILIIIANYYEDIAHNLVLGATECCAKNDINNDIITVTGSFEIPFIINIESENFIIFIEKIRKANSDFLLLDKDKIKKDLSIPRKKKIYGVFLSEIYNSSTIEYNTKYIN